MHTKSSDKNLSTAQEIAGDDHLRSGLPLSSSRHNSARQADAAQNSARSKKKSASAFRTISEVADGLGVQQHVLRFWETKFSQVKPLKRGGGRRYYRPEDVRLLQAIHNLLYVEGYTIKGVQKLLREVGKGQIVDNFSSDAIGGDTQSAALMRRVEVVEQVSAEPGTAQNEDIQTAPEAKKAERREALEAVLDELKELRGMVKNRG